MAVSVAPLAKGQMLPPLQLTQQGDVTSITIRAFAAGKLEEAVARRMASAAESRLRKVFKYYCRSASVRAVFRVRGRSFLS